MMWPFSRKGNHQWSDWNVTERGGVFNPMWVRDRIGSYLVQERYCLRCGKVQMESKATTMQSGVRKIETRTASLRKDGVGV